jgi:hypothetical protein
LKIENPRAAVKAVKVHLRNASDLMLEFLDGK